jgi:hypothetical protein
LRRTALGNENRDVTTAERMIPRTALSGPQLGKRPSTANPFLVLGLAFALGIALARWIDWRTHAHPRD